MIEHTKGVKEKVQAITAQQQAQNQQSAQADVAVARKNQNSRKKQHKTQLIRYTDTKTLTFREQL